MKIEGIGGLQTIGAGSQAQPGLDKNGALLVSGLHARYYRMVKEGNVYLAQTAVTGVAPGTAVGTTAAFALYNPAASGKDLVVLKLGMGYVSGTLGAGEVSLCVSTNTVAAATTGTAIPARNAYVGAAANNVGSALTTATLPATPTPVGVFCSLTALLASTAVQPYTVENYLDGLTIVQPGATISLQATAAAGSTPLVVYSVVWYETAI